jgi:hypothetical protein
MFPPQWGAILASIDKGLGYEDLKKLGHTPNDIFRACLSVESYAALGT